MVTIASLWLAILLSAVLVWFASALVWMVLPHHKKEYRSLPDEDAVRAVLKSQTIEPGLYNIPHCKNQEEMKDPAVQEKFKEGPVAILTVSSPGLFNMGKALSITFVYYLVVGCIVAYLASRTLPAGSEYLEVFRVTGTTAWLAYGFAYIPDAPWFGKPWSSVFKALGDALLYALLTAGVFGWLWP